MEKDIENLHAIRRCTTTLKEGEELKVNDIIVLVMFVDEILPDNKVKCWWEESKIPYEMIFDKNSITEIVKS